MKRLFLLFVVLTMIAAGAAVAAASSDLESNKDAIVEAPEVGAAPEHWGGHGEITEEVITFENEGGTIYGTFVRPAGNRWAPAVLMLHGFTGDRNEGPVLQPDFTFDDFMYERTANVFAENGIASLRIDFRGSGESLDQFGFEDTTFSGQISDAYAAVEWLDDQRKIGRIGILGLSQGGLVGAITAESHRRVRSLALWSPVANPVDTYRTVLGNEWIGGTLEDPEYGGDAVWAGLNQASTDMILPWGAPVTLNQSFFEELYSTDPIVAISDYRKPLQVVVGERDDIVTPQPQYGETYMTYHKGYEELVVLDGDHVFDVFTGNGAPALDEAIAESLDWFTRTLRHRW